MAAPLPENQPDTWVVGIGEIPEWVTEIPDYSLSMDDHGNAYFQFEDRAVIVARGSMIYKDEDRIVFGERWGIVRNDGEISGTGVLCLPEELKYG